MADKPSPLPKLVSPQDFETLIEDFQQGGPRRQKWISIHSIASLLDLLLSSILRKDFPLPLKLQLLLFLEEFPDILFTTVDTQFLDYLIEALRAVIQAPIDGVHITSALKEQIMVSTTSILISIEAIEKYHGKYTEGLIELLLMVINRPNFGLDRQTRAIACECLRELEKAYPCLLSEKAGHLWSFCQNERTHASQSYILLFTSVIYNIVVQKLNVSILNTSMPIIPFNVPQFVLASDTSKELLGLNYKELRRAMAFLLEWPQVLTPSGMVEFMAMILPVAMVLELQPSMLKVQFFGMIYSFDPLLCHVVLMMYLHFIDAFDGKEGVISHRLVLISKEAQHNLVFRLLALHWLMGFYKLIFSREVGKSKTIVETGSSFYPTVFDPLALKALKLDLLALCSVYVEILGLEYDLQNEGSTMKLVVKLFEDGLVSVSGFQWLPPWSTETALAFRTFHKFLIGSSSHNDNDPSTTRVLMDSTIFHKLEEKLVGMMLASGGLIPVIVTFIDRLLGCPKHFWLGERLLQKFDELLLPKVRMDYKLVSCFPIFERIAETDTIPPSRLLELLTRFLLFLVEKHGPDTGLKSWSQGSRVLGICRTMLIHHHSSRLFLQLSRLLAFACLCFPDLEVRDNARIYLRMIMCVPGIKLREMLNIGEQFLGISPSQHSFSAPSPRSSQKFNTFKNISSFIHLDRVIPLLVKQSWSLSLSQLFVRSGMPASVEGIRDNEAPLEERKMDDSTNTQIVHGSKRNNQPGEPLRVLDAKISEILNTLRKHFACIPDLRHMPGLKVRISCNLRFESRPFNHMLGVDFTAGSTLDGVNALPAIYATVLKFSSSAPYGTISPYHIPFLLGEPSNSDDVPCESSTLDIVPIENGSREKKSFRVLVVIELEPREPTPGLVDVHIETNAENGQIIQGQLHSITVGIEDMFVKPIVPPDIPEDAVPGYNLDLFDALWEACDTSSNTGREVFPLKGGKGVAAINGTQTVKLLEIPASHLIQATERHLSPFVVGVIGEPLVDIVRDGGVISNIIWKDAFLDNPVADLHKGPLCLTYNEDENERSHGNIRKTNMGCILVLIFLPPRFHLLFQMEVCDVSTLVRIRTDHWPSLAYIDDYLEALYLM